MLSVILYKFLNARSGEVPLRFRLRDGDTVDIIYEPGQMVSARDLMAFTQEGEVRERTTSYNVALRKEIAHYRSLLFEEYIALAQTGTAVTAELLTGAVEARIRKEKAGLPSVGKQSVAARFRLYVEEEHDTGHTGIKRYREGRALAGKLERYLLVRDCPGIQPRDFTAEMVLDFEKFCMDEYLYASNPKYAAIYPRVYGDEGRHWPKKRLSEEWQRPLFIIFRDFWMDLVSFGEVQVSPYEGYVEWMTPKKHFRYQEVIWDPQTLKMVEFQKVLNTPVPEEMAPIRNAFIVHCCLGLRGEDYRKLSIENVRVSSGGIPYIYYRHVDTQHKGKETFYSDFRVPIVRVAFDIIMRTHFECMYGQNSTQYNRLIRKFLRFCGITREVLLYNDRTGISEEVPLCDAFNQGNVHMTHMDIVHEQEQLRGVRGRYNTGSKALGERSKMPLEAHFTLLNQAFGQKPYRVDENLHIVEGAPLESQDPMVYKEIPEKKYQGGTVPYIVEDIHAIGPEEPEPEDRIEIRYHRHLTEERPLFLCGDQFAAWLAGLDENRRRKIHYGLLLLRRLWSFEVPFVKKEKGSLYSLRTVLRGCVDATYFYVNEGAIVILQGCRLKEAKLRSRPPRMEDLEELRWAHVIGKAPVIDYGAVLDGIYGALGSEEREKSWEKACGRFVNQTLIDVWNRVRKEKGGDSFEDETGVIAYTGHRARTMPLRYLRRILKAMNCRAVITRMVSEEEIENLRRRPDGGG